MIASHHTGMITAQLFTSLLLLSAASVAFVVAVTTKRLVSFAAIVSLAVASVGAYGLAEVPALRHNHLCHAHHHDMCNNDNPAEGDEHNHGEHWFGGRAAS